jgi:hypothetical protein
VGFPRQRDFVRDEHWNVYMATTLKTSHSVGVNRLASTSERGRNVPRWTLNRAGIINVYQYGNETLHFGGGRSGR